MIDRPVKLNAADGYWVGSFEAMASPCELFMEVDDETLANRLLNIAAREAWRIESKFSRYVSDNPVDRINNSGGQAVEVDEEVGQLLDFAQACWQLSEGMFDITSGVLRRIWHFDGGHRLPSQQQVDQILPLVGWHKLTWERPYLTLPPGMQVDFGGIGKEYAVDRTLQLLQQQTDQALLINYGGDICAGGARQSNLPWSVGLEHPSHPDSPKGVLRIRRGGLATSGDTRRYLLHQGKRYGHVLNPKNGWPVEGGLRSVTVAAASCTEAGLLATMALLQGPDAEEFLQNQDVQYWVIP
ncbi:MAG: FAD:protein FMN transferase [Candidatus Thiodiazotropha lotti]|uniref:FAD:protein FMN transferase n=1 Tax=Candidatus Thiodiazotropha endoloripes TaxID=1818881 RepID=A0A1E2UN27_9GAMM|nr:FAD:protein FMN transferase [Candidatus Thiodiazotropha endoloripes]MCG7898079.1 FAD:protein FMN transferase [Candidatus Thiodiazotropha weberae]MCG7991396.1 FAD:protein FMN transferase [Candidatus Thiodiazotropha lotti]MCG7902906.1 FAD:protein FMN transferase [Candidatus Thiodiazotropha weberae]MCG7912587.1 FAD:protein FMN transferase [Candidatus Thiodiazotropha weberae]MCG8001108.1 FAD:protein FMN transferase [Candidatus Thiodiazotropha lotti]